MHKRDFALLTRVIAGKTGVSIQPTPPPSEEWKADTINRVIYYPDKYYYGDSDLGIAIHESGHIRFSGLSDISQKEMGKYLEENRRVIGLKDLWNLLHALEDIRIEQLMRGVYKGASYYLKTASLQYYNMAEYREVDSSLCRHYCLYFIYKYALSEELAGDYLEAVELGKKTRKLESRDKIIKAIKGSKDIIPKLFDCKTTDELLELIKTKILKHYIPLIDQREFTEEQLMARIMEVLGKLAEKIKEARDKAEKDREEGKPGKAERLQPGGLPNDGENDPEDKEVEEGQLNPNLENKIKDYLTEKIPSMSRAISIIKDKDIIRSEGSYDRGKKLITRRLYKTKAKNYKVFSRPDSLGEGHKNLAFMLLLDESGSMFRRERAGEVLDKMGQAILSTALLGEGLKRAGKLYSVIGFQGKTYTHKGFKDKHLTAGEYAKLDHFAHKNGELGGCSWNSDGYAINQAVEQFKAIPPSYKKVLIVLSDGRPAPHREYKQYDLRAEIKKAEKEINHIFAVGICDNSVKEYYKNNIVINNPSELPEVITGLFKEVVGKRIR